jgi:hypothetical protein
MNLTIDIEDFNIIPIFLKDRVDLEGQRRFSGMLKK